MSCPPRSDRNRQIPVFRVLVASMGVLLPLLAGCPGSLEGTFPPLTGTGTGGMMGGTGGAGGTVACDPTTPDTGIFATKCPFCHAPNGQPPDLVTAPVAMNLSTLKSDTATPASKTTCPNMPFIDKANPSASVLLKRVTGTSCGPLMPFFAMTPDPDVVACITSWVMTP